jgi:hypothetical protein
MVQRRLSVIAFRAISLLACEAVRTGMTSPKTNGYVGMNGDVIALFMAAPQEPFGVRQANVLSAQQQPDGTVTSVTIEDLAQPLVFLRH